MGDFYAFLVVVETGETYRLFFVAKKLSGLLGLLQTCELLIPTTHFIRIRIGEGERIGRFSLQGYYCGMGLEMLNIVDIYRRESDRYL